MSASQLIYGTPAKLAVSGYDGLVTLNGAGTFALSTPFPVSNATICFLTSFNAASGPLYYTKVNGAAGVGTVNIVSSAGAADAGKLVAVSVYNTFAEG